MKIIAKIFSGLILLTVVFGIFIYMDLFGAPQKEGNLEQFVVPLSSDFNIAEQLKTQGFVKNSLVFQLVFGDLGSIEKGAYKISKSMDIWEVKRILQKPPYMKWVVIPEGLRKEEIAEILMKDLGWNISKANTFLKETNASDDYFEGVYFPDTYLIPVDESTEQVLNRLRSKFEEKFQPYLQEALDQNIKWVTVLKIASIVQREASGDSDMPIIAGVIWNRLLDNMKLDIDATVQYARGETNQGWWSPISPDDKKIDSPYNTYLYQGLPPHPISNPGLSAIDAVLHPTKTKCIYYLHDKDKNIHCSETYQEHLDNIEKFLK